MNLPSKVGNGQASQDRRGDVVLGVSDSATKQNTSKKELCNLVIPLLMSNEG